MRLLAALKHNKREIQEQGQNIDPTRSNQNYALAGAQTSAEVAKTARTLMMEAGVPKLRKNGVAALEIVFSLPIGAAIDQSTFFVDCLEWVKSHFSVPVLSFDVHLDESAPHAHCLLLPLSGGRMCGDALKGDKSKLKMHHTSFHDNVGRKHGLHQPRRKSTGTAKAKLGKLVLDKLRSDPAINSVVWPIIRDQVMTSPELFADMLGIKLEATKPNRDAASIMIQKVKTL